MVIRPDLRKQIRQKQKVNKGELWMSNRNNPTGTDGPRKSDRNSRSNVVTVGCRTETIQQEQKFKKNRQNQKGKSDECRITKKTLICALGCTRSRRKAFDC